MLLFRMNMNLHITCFEEVSHLYPKRIVSLRISCQEKLLIGASGVHFVTVVFSSIQMCGAAGVVLFSKTSSDIIANAYCSLLDNCLTNWGSAMDEYDSSQAYFPYVYELIPFHSRGVGSLSFRETSNLV